MAHSTHHRHHLTLVQPPEAACAAPGRDGNDDAHNPVAEERDQMAPAANVAFSGCVGDVPYTFYTLRATYSFSPVPPLDRPALVPPAHRRAKVGSALEKLASLTRSSLALHPSGRRRVEREHRQRLLRWPADDLRMGRDRTTRSPQSVAADGPRGASVPRERILDSMARGTVAEYLTSMLAVRGSVRFW